MNKVNTNKILPSIVSVMIVVGMTIQSFATNVDMAAFVKKDKYMTKYYELDWRIDDIDKSLEKLYKFTCTNVKSFGGTGRDINIDNTFYQQNPTQTYHWYMFPIADLSEEGYLRVNNADALNWFGNHSKTDKMEYEIPASLCKWRNGVELYPNTKVKFSLTRSWPNTTSISQQATFYTEVIMGPFKKFPYLNGTGAGWTFCTTDSRFLGYTQLMLTAVQYARDTDTQPTSWTAMTGQVNPTTYDNNSNSLPAEFKKGVMTKEQLEEAYSVDRYKIRTSQMTFFPNTAFGVDTSKFDKVWLRFYSPASNASGGQVACNEWTITTWNYNK